MKIRYGLFWVLLSFAAQSAAVDNARPLRVITLSPHATELAFAAGLGDNVIAVSQSCDHPQQALALEKVASYRAINVERILALKPDLVIAWQEGNPARQLAQLEKLGVALFYSAPHSFASLGADLERLAQFSPRPQQALDAAKRLRSEVAKFEQAQQGKPKVSYFYELSQAPLMTNNGKSWPQPLFSLCGGENVFAQSAVPYPQVSVEQVLTRKPQALFASSNSGDLSRWLRWKSILPAAANDALFVMEAAWFGRPSLRALDGVKTICAALDSVRAKTTNLAPPQVGSSKN
ncbi:MAG: vitamin B12 ABC transporter substrate-binding protein BtuF [Enterovibrio sp.]